MTIPDRRDLLPLNTNGIEQVDTLHAGGRTEEARNLLIACAHVCWRRRWSSRRDWSLRRLGGALDTRRFPDLKNVAEPLIAESPDAAGRFLDYLRQRPAPDMRRHIQAPPDADSYATVARQRGGQAANRNALLLWRAAMASGDAQSHQRLEKRLSTILHPWRMVDWHETNYPWVKLVFSALHFGGIDDHTLCMLCLFGLDYAEQANVVSHIHDPPQPSVGGNHILYESNSSGSRPKAGGYPNEMACAINHPSPT